MMTVDYWWKSGSVGRANWCSSWRCSFCFWRRASFNLSGRLVDRRDNLKGSIGSKERERAVVALGWNGRSWHTAHGSSWPAHGSFMALVEDEARSCYGTIYSYI